MIDRRFHVYVHHRMTDDSVFYVGKATKSRATNTTHRSEWWKRIYAKHGRRVRYIKRNIPEPCSLSLEMALINAYGRENLCNLSDGGNGVSGLSNDSRIEKSKRFSDKRNPSYDGKLYSFWNDKYGSVASTKLMMRRVFGLPSSALSKLVYGEQKYLKGWVLLENKGKFKGTKYRPNGSTRESAYSFIHDDGKIWTGRLDNFVSEFRLDKSNVYRLRTGRIERYRGWRYKDDEQLPDTVKVEADKMKRNG